MKWNVSLLFFRALVEICPFEDRYGVHVLCPERDRNSSFLSFIENISFFQGCKCSELRGDCTASQRICLIQ
jgi:hypothetical protein